MIVDGNFNSDGQKHGKWSEYVNGKLKEVNTFKDGMKDGIEELYDDSGKIFRILKYKNDKIIEVLK